MWVPLRGCGALARLAVRIEIVRLPRPFEEQRAEPTRIAQQRPAHVRSVPQAPRALDGSALLIRGDAKLGECKPDERIQFDRQVLALGSHYIA